MSVSHFLSMLVLRTANSIKLGAEDELHWYFHLNSGIKKNSKIPRARRGKILKSYHVRNFI